MIIDYAHCKIEFICFMRSEKRKKEVSTKGSGGEREHEDKLRLHQL